MELKDKEQENFERKLKYAKAKALGIFIKYGNDPLNVNFVEFIHNVKFSDGTVYDFSDQIQKYIKNFVDDSNTESKQNELDSFKRVVVSREEIKDMLGYIPSLYHIDFGAKKIYVVKKVDDIISI